MKAYHIYLLRHGMTQANSEGRYIGRTDVPLSPEGEAELARMAQDCVYPGAAAFFTSPMLRCRQSLQILYPDSAPRVVEGLSECDFGDFEGKTIDELEKNEEYRAWIAEKGKSAPPHGESSENFQKRCCFAFESIVGDLLRSGTDRAVIMAHGGTLMFILGSYGFPRRPFYEWLAGNGAGYELVLTPQLWMSARALEVAARIPGVPEEDGERQDDPGFSGGEDE